jgi:hypothetical protein
MCPLNLKTSFLLLLLLQVSQWGSGGPHQDNGFSGLPRTASSAPPPSFTQSPYPPRSLVRDDQTHPHRPRLVVSHSTCPPLSSPPHANSFVIGPPVKKNTHTHTPAGLCETLEYSSFWIPLPHVLGPKHEQQQRPRDSEEFRIGENGETS